MPPPPDQKLPAIAMAAVVGLLAVTWQFLTGGWLFVLAYKFVLAPAVVAVHVLVHARSCEAPNEAGARVARVVSNALLLAASLAQVDYGDTCGWYTWTALLSPETPCMRTALPLLGRFHNLLVLAPLAGSWLALVVLPKVGTRQGPKARDAGD